MASTTQVKVEGLRELGFALKELDAKLQRKAGKASVAAGAKVIRDEARRNAPLLDPTDKTKTRKPGTIKKNIWAKADRERNGQFYARVWVRSLGKKKIGQFKAATGKASSENPDDPYYWWFVEFGTVRSAAHPFMRPAFESKKDEALKAIQARLTKDLVKEVGKP